MTQLARYAVGEPWPHPIAGEGMTLWLEVGADALDAMLVITIASPTNKEVRLLRAEPLRISIVPAAPLVWIVLQTQGGTPSVDAPYAVGVNPKAEALRSCAALARTRPETQRGTLTVATVDAATGITQVLRLVSLTRTWWIALADALDACPAPISQAEHAAAMHRDMVRWPRTETMLRHAAVSERAGTI